MMISLLLWVQPAGLEIHAWGTEPKRDDAATQLRVRAALTSVLTGYVDWPMPTAPEGTKHPKPTPKELGPLVIGVVSNDRVAIAIREGAKNKKPHGRTVKVVVINLSRDGEIPEAEWRACEAIYLPDNVRVDYQKLQAFAHKHHVLTVSQQPGFVTGGGMIGFHIGKSGKYGFELGVESAKAAGLKFRSKLLKRSSKPPGKKSD